MSSTNETRTRLECREIDRPALEGFLQSLPAPLSDLQRATMQQLDFVARSDERGLFAVGDDLLVPRMFRPVALPVRLGERTLWSQRLPGMVIPPVVQRVLTTPDQASAMVDWLLREYPGVPVLLPELLSDSAVRQAVDEAAGDGYWLVGDEPSRHLFHVFGDSFEAFFGSKKSKYKTQLRKKMKVFDGLIGDRAVFKEYRAPETVAEFLAAASQVNRKTYQFNLLGESISDDPITIEKYEGLARDGAFRSYILWRDDVPICFVVGSQTADGYFSHLYTGFDPDWRDCFPGINCNVMLLQRLYEEDRPVVLDFGCGDADYKRLFATLTRESSNLLLVPRGPRLALRLGLHRLSERANELAVVMLDRLGVKDSIKRLLRRRAERAGGQ